METQRDLGHYGTIEYSDILGRQFTQVFYKDSRGTLYKTYKPLLKRLKKQVDWLEKHAGYTVTKVSTFEAKVVEVRLTTTLVTPADLK